MKKTFLYLGILGSLSLGLPELGIAQNLIILQGKATVPILNENLAHAEEKAILLAKKTILKNLLSQSIASSILKQAQKLINTEILNKPDRFIESIRILNSEDSHNLTKLSLVLEARVFQSQLLSALRHSNLAFSKDPIQQVVLVYDANDSFWNNVQKKRTLQTLKRLLVPYRIAIQKTVPLASEWWHDLKSNPDQSLPKRLIANSKNAAFLLMDFNKRKLPNKKKTELSVTLHLKLYEDSKGKFLREIQATAIFKKRQPRKEIAQLLKQMSLEWNPLISALISTDPKIGAAIQVKLAGFTTPEQETIFVENVLKPQRLRQFHLYKLAKNYVIYQGFYSGNRQSLLSQLKTTKSPFYRIIKIQWQGNQLEIQVQWIEKPSPLETYQPDEVVEQWIKTKGISRPQKKVPSERIKTTYALPQSVAVYDFLRSRGDSTFYKIEWARPGDTVKVTWQRIDKTKIKPILSIYDAQRNLVKQHTPKWEGGINFQYRLPKNQPYFYIRISDQIGYIEGEAGSYLSVHYVLKVSSPKKEP